MAIAIHRPSTPQSASPMTPISDVVMMVVVTLAEAAAVAVLAFSIWPLAKLLAVDVNAPISASHLTMPLVAPSLSSFKPKAQQRERRRR